MAGFLSAASSIGERVGSSITGNVNKAYIMFRNKKPSNAKDGSSETGAANLAAKLKQNGSIKTGSLLGGDDEKLIEAANNSGYLPIKVQYNPNTLTFYGRAGELRNNNSGVSGVERHNNYNIPEETILSVELEFDDTNLTDAFMIDSSVASIGGAAGAVKQMVSKDYSVRNISELFVAAMFHPDTRLVVFAWNQTVFWGEITSADVSYTMFNKKGNPIRSKISIQIRQDKRSQPIDDDGESIEAYETEKYWENAYNNMFQAKSGKSVFGVDNMASNIFNLN